VRSLALPYRRVHKFLCVNMGERERVSEREAGFQVHSIEATLLILSKSTALHLKKYLLRVKDGSATLTV
jgi:hypothetical protein